RRAKSAPVFGLVYGRERRARTQDATTTGTEDVPGHIENAESRAVQESSDHILLIELMLGGEREGIDAAKLTVWCVLDEFFDRAHGFRLRRLPQNTEEGFDFSGNFHGIIGLITAAITVWPGTMENKSQMNQTFPSAISVVGEVPRILLSMLITSLGRDLSIACEAIRTPSF